MNGKSYLIPILFFCYPVTQIELYGRPQICVPAHCTLVPKRDSDNQSINEGKVVQILTSPLIVFV